MQRAESQLEEAVAAERARGKTWAEIGEKLGVSRQAAFKRFGSVTSTSGEVLEPRDVSHLPSLAEKFFHHVAAGEQELVTHMIHPSARGELTWEVISSTWDQCLENWGALESFAGHYITHPHGTEYDSYGSPANEKMLGVAVAGLTLRQEAGETLGRVAFDRDDEIVGVLFLDPHSEPEQWSF